MRFAGSNPQLASFMAGAPRYDQQADTFSKARTYERNATHEAESYLAASGLDAMGRVQSAQEQARGIIAQGEAAAAGAEAQGMASMMSCIAGGIGNMSFGGGGAPTSTNTSAAQLGIMANAAYR